MFKSLIWCFISILIASGEAQAALTASACVYVLDSSLQKKAEALTANHEEIRVLEYKKNPGAFEYRIDKAIRLATDLMDQMGIEWQFHEKTKRILVITPNSKGSFLNRLAAGMKQNLKGLRMEYDPRDLRVQEAINYDESHSRIVIDPEIIRANAMTPGLYHEIRHAFNQRKFYEGRFVDFAGTLDLYSKKVQFNNIYTDAFSLDEMVTYVLESYQMVRLWNQFPEANTTAALRDLEFNTKYGASLTGWTYRISERTARTMEQIIARPEEWKKSESTVYLNGYGTKETTYRLRADREFVILIFDTFDKNMDGVFQRNTSVMIRHGKFGSTFSFPVARDTKTDQEWFLAAKSRAQFVANQTGNLVPLWEDLDFVSRLKDVEESQRIVQEMRSLILAFQQEPEVEEVSPP